MKRRAARSQAAATIAGTGRDLAAGSSIAIAVVAPGPFVGQLGLGHSGDGSEGTHPKERSLRFRRQRRRR